MPGPPVDRTTVARFARSLAFSSASAGSIALLLVLLIVAGRVLGQVDYGRFSFALALSMLLETFVDFGLREVVGRTVARDHSSAARVVRHTLGLKLVFAVVGFALYVGLVQALRPEPEVRLACYLMGLSAVLRSFLLTMRHTLNGLERFGLESAVLVTDRALLLALGAGALLSGYGLIGLGVAFVVARLVAVPVAYAVARAQIGPIGVGADLGEWRDLQRTALPFGAFIVVLTLYSYIDTVLLGLLRSDAETGLYNAGYRVFDGLNNIPVILATVVAPKLARSFVSDRGRHGWIARTSLTAGTLVALPILGVGWVLADDILRLLFGEAFVAAAPALRVLMVGLVFSFPLEIARYVAISVNAERSLLKVAGIGCVGNVALNLWLIPRFGMLGAASATVLSEALSLGLILAAVRLGRSHDRPVAGMP